MGQAIQLPPINVKAAKRLSAVFHAAADLRLNQDRDVSKWLEGLIAYAGRCQMCHGIGTVNFEQAHGWDEPCPKCQPQHKSGGYQ